MKHSGLLGCEIFMSHNGILGYKNISFRKIYTTINKTRNF